MTIKVYEGESLGALIEQAKQDLGEIEILYYEIEKEGLPFIPFLQRKRYKLYVVPKEEEEREEITIDREIKKIEEELEELKELMRDIKESSQAVPPPPLPVPTHVEDKVNCPPAFLSEFTGDAVELLNLLVKKGVSQEAAKEIVREACGLDIESEKLDLSTNTFREAVLKGVEAKVKFTGEFQVKEGEKKAYVFLGPTGVGKTTNLFKIASKFVLENELKVGVLTTDTFKVGAVQQVRTYASILNIPFFVATDHKKLREIIETIKDLDVILIDTVGRSHYDYWRLGEIKATLSGLEIPSEMVLLVSCNYRTDEAVEVVNRYRSFFPISSLFFTKIDETSKPGILVNLPLKTQLPVSYISVGQRVPEDIRLLTPELITSYLLGE